MGQIVTEKFKRNQWGSMLSLFNHVEEAHKVDICIKLKCTNDIILVKILWVLYLLKPELKPQYSTKRKTS